MMYWIYIDILEKNKNVVCSIGDVIYSDDVNYEFTVLYIRHLFHPHVNIPHYFTLFKCVN